MDVKAFLAVYIEYDEVSAAGLEDVLRFSDGALSNKDPSNVVYTNIGIYDVVTDK